MSRLGRVLRLLGRLCVIAIVTTFVAVVGFQYARVIGKNLAMAAQLAQTESDLRTLESKERESDREIRRLSDPAGAIPEIHDKLHLVRQNEAIIYLQHVDRR